jgi:hypothetical protein
LQPVTPTVIEDRLTATLGEPFELIVTQAIVPPSNRRPDRPAA